MDKKNPPTKNSGLTLVEILVSMLIFALIMGGLANLFFATKRLTFHQRYRLVASELGRFYLDFLHKDVRQDEWGSNCLGSGAGCSGDEVVDGMTYSPTFVFNDLLGGRVRKIRLTINWTEPFP
jgi:prepilin-type N-terminal cleavage/methylation domain-containing protein